MSQRDKCILETTITQYLDDENNWLTTAIDSFYVRSYELGDFVDKFSFISNIHNKFYLIYSPEFGSRLTNNIFYTETKNGRLQITKRNYATKFNITLLDIFLKAEVSGRGTFADQVSQAEHLLPSLFPHMLRERVIPAMLIDSIRRRPKEQATAIMNTIKDVISSEELVMSPKSKNFQVYRNVLGFVIVDFKQNATGNLELDFYLIPDQFRYAYFPHIDASKFENCLKR